MDVNCSASGVQCSDVTGTQPSLVAFSLVYINWNYADGWGNPLRQLTLSHELGHALGLAHHDDCGSCLMRRWAFYG